MAMPSNYRWIVVGSVFMRNRANSPNFAPEFTIADLWDAILSRIQDGNAYRSYQSNSRLMWCLNTNESDDYYQFLLQVGDKNVTGMSYLHFQTLLTRDIDKEDEEGSHYTAHVLIKKQADAQGRHLLLVEKVPGVYMTSIKDHFTWAFNEAAYQKTAASDSGDERSFRPVFEIDGHQSKTVGDALRTGVLQDVEFVSYDEDNDDGLDELTIVQEVIHEAKWNIRRHVTEEEARTLFGRIGGFLEMFRGPPEAARVFIRIKGENGQIKRSEVSHNGEEILEQTFVQNEVVSDFDEELTQRCDEFREDLITKMIEVAEVLDD